MKAWLANHCKIADLPLSSFSKNYLPHIQENVRGRYAAEDSNIDINTLAFTAYRLQESPENKRFFDAPFRNNALDGVKIYIVLEETTGFCDSNSNMLTLEYILEQGVGQFDYEHETQKLLAYIAYLHAYINKQY